MNTKTMEQFSTMNDDVLVNFEGGVPAGWYSPFGAISDNLICKNGYRYTKENWNKGLCRVNWESVVNGVVGEISVAIASGAGRRP